MKRVNLTILCAALLAGAALPADAQQTRYPVKTMDFDLWCTEQAHLSPDRCDQRLPDDVQKFEAYRKIIEKYEIPYLQDRDQKLRFDRDIMHNDPIDKPNSDPSQAPPVTGN